MQRHLLLIFLMLIAISVAYAQEYESDACTTVFEQVSSCERYASCEKSTTTILDTCYKNETCLRTKTQECAPHTVSGTCESTACTTPSYACNSRCEQYGTKWDSCATRELEPTEQCTAYETTCTDTCKGGLVIKTGWFGIPYPWWDSCASTVQTCTTTCSATRTVWSAGDCKGGYVTDTSNCVKEAHDTCYDWSKTTCSTAYYSCAQTATTCEVCAQYEQVPYDCSNTITTYTAHIQECANQEPDLHLRVCKGYPCNEVSTLDVGLAYYLSYTLEHVYHAGVADVLVSINGDAQRLQTSAYQNAQGTYPFTARESNEFAIIVTDQIDAESSIQTFIINAQQPVQEQYAHAVTTPFNAQDGSGKRAARTHDASGSATGLVVLGGVVGAAGLAYFTRDTLLPLLISMIPVVGNVVDLAQVAWKKIKGMALSVWDYVISGFSSLGLGADVSAVLGALGAIASGGISTGASVLGVATDLVSGFVKFIIKQTIKNVQELFMLGLKAVGLVAKAPASLIDGVRFAGRLVSRVLKKFKYLLTTGGDVVANVSKFFNKISEYLAILSGKYLGVTLNTRTIQIADTFGFTGTPLLAIDDVLKKGINIEDDVLNWLKTKGKSLGVLGEKELSKLLKITNLDDLKAIKRFLDNQDGSLTRTLALVLSKENLLKVAKMEIPVLIKQDGITRNINDIIPEMERAIEHMKEMNKVGVSKIILTKLDGSTGLYRFKNNEATILLDASKLTGPKRYETSVHEIGHHFFQVRQSTLNGKVITNEALTELAHSINQKLNHQYNIELFNSYSGIKKRVDVVENQLKDMAVHLLVIENKAVIDYKTYFAGYDQRMNMPTMTNLFTAVETGNTNKIIELVAKKKIVVPFLGETRVLENYLDFETAKKLASARASIASITSLKTYSEDINVIATEYAKLRGAR
ncbi:hypothetical protein COT72_03645 [archaeon CG10_big_fil_rev_8_21_14_0_10_43_11]|nr:MAG: hypothetical protein COT72_03645 [archaeon CG10_big_fil_rev_8_21_14_0_10_43_11]